MVRIFAFSALTLLAATIGFTQVAAQVPIKIFAAGSLMAPLTAVAEALRREQRIDIDFTLRRCPRLAASSFV